MHRGGGGAHILPWQQGQPQLLRPSGARARDQQGPSGVRAPSFQSQSCHRTAAEFGEAVSVVGLTPLSYRTVFVSHQGLTSPGEQAVSGPIWKQSCITGDLLGLSVSSVPWDSVCSGVSGVSWWQRDDTM